MVIATAGGARNAAFANAHDADQRLEQGGRTFALMERIRAWCEAGPCRPHVDRTFHLDEAPQAVRALLQRNAVGRLAVVM